MKFIRWFLCKMDIRHRPVEKWMPLTASGLSEIAAKLYACKIEDGNVSYLRCMDCEMIIAPFEASERGWKVLQ